MYKPREASVCPLFLPFGIAGYGTASGFVLEKGSSAGRPSVGEGKEEPLVITFTERAKDRFRSVSPIGARGGEVMRLDAVKQAPNGDAPKLAVYLGEPEEGDEPVRHEGEPLVWVSVAVSAAYDGCVVDVLETPEGIGFAIGRPEAGRDARS
jgi:hypothetical protein